MLKLILIGSLITAGVMITLLTFSFFVLNNQYVLSRFFIGLGIVAYLLIIFGFYAHKHYRIAAWMLILLYASVAGTILFIWGINAPVGILTLGFVILLSSVMLGIRYVPGVTVGIFLLLCLVQALHAYTPFEPDNSSLSLDSTFGDVFTYGIIFGIFAIIAWLSGRQKSLSLQRALDAEDALEFEKASLATKLQEQTLSLREAQLEEMKQLYRFAELGQLTTVILHELANYLTVLTLDIEELPNDNKKIDTIERVKESIKYLEQMVRQVRYRLKSNHEIKRFSAAKLVRDTVNTLKPRAANRGVKLVFRIKVKNEGKSFQILGDSLRLSQVVTILVNNAVDASATDGQAPPNAIVEILVLIASKGMDISVIDYGVGIPQASRKELFQPLKSTKANGLGMGLYIAQQIIITHFKGTLSLSNKEDCTEFIIHLQQT